MKHHSVRTPRIVQENPGRWFVPAAIVLLMLLAAAGLAYFFFDRADWCGETTSQTVDMAQIRALEERIDRLEKERDEYREQAAQFERASQIDRQAVSTVQVDLKTLQEERSALRRQVEFLQSLVSGDVTSLQLVGFKIQASSEQNAYEYALTVSKRAKERERVQGGLLFAIIGDQAGKTRELGMADLGFEVESLKMNFQNFQNFKGVFTLPSDFEPETVKVKVEPTGDKFKSFARGFPWNLEND